MNSNRRSLGTAGQQVALDEFDTFQHAVGLGVRSGHFQGRRTDVVAVTRQCSMYLAAETAMFPLPVPTSQTAIVSPGLKAGTRLGQIH